MSSQPEPARRARALPRPTVPRRVLVGCVVGTLMVAIVVAGVVFSGSVRHQLALSFTRVPTAFTELYFDPELPVASSDDDATTVNFVLHSHEATTVTYRYVVTGTRGSASFTTEGSVSLLPGQTRQVSAALIPGSTSWSRIGVVLLDRPEQISWLADPSDGQQTAGPR